MEQRKNPNVANEQHAIVCRQVGEFGHDKNVRLIVIDISFTPPHSHFVDVVIPIPTPNFMAI